MRQILTLDLRTTNVVRTFPLGEEPTGMALLPSPPRFVVTCSGTSDYVVILDCATGQERSRWLTGAGACSPVVSLEKGVVYVCQRYDATVGVYDLETGICGG